MTQDFPHDVQDEINKRLTLNLIIQGAAQHAFLTSHYIVRDELNAIDGKLIRLYDQVALAGFVQYWRDEFVLVHGWPDRFWRRATRPNHPFSKHTLLSRHGLSLAQASKKRAFERCRIKGVTRIPMYFTWQFLTRIVRTAIRERKHRHALAELGKIATQRVWNIPHEKLDGVIQKSVRFGNPRTPTNFRAAHLRSGTVGFGGVLGESQNLRVVARGWLWPILSHELVKGTVELICMHGLNQLSDATYRRVVNVADRMEYEPWMLQTGAELWRQLLVLLPVHRTVSEMVMHIARLPAKALEQLMLAVLEDQDLAKRLLMEIATEDEDQN